MAETLLTFLPNSADISSAVDNAQFAVRNGHRVLDFADAAIQEEAKWTDVLPKAYAGAGFDVIITWLAKTAIVGDAVFAASLERHDAGTDLDTDSFGAEKVVVATAPGTSGQPQTSIISFANGIEIDNLAVGEEFRIKIRTLALDSSWTIVGDVQITSVQIEQVGGGGGGYFVEGTGGAASVIGKGIVAPTAAGIDSAAHGDGSAVSSVGTQSIAWGKDNTVNHPFSGAWGRDVKITAGLGYGECSWGAGYDIDLFGEYCFGQGRNIHLGGGGYTRQTIFGQGHDIYVATAAAQLARDVMVQGSSIYAYQSYSFIQGQGHTIRTQRTFCQGKYNETTEYFDGSSYTGTMRDLFLQGQDNIISYAPASGGSRGFAVFLQGYNNRMYGTNLSDVYWCSFASGRDITTSGVYNFAQGFDLTNGAYAYPNANSFVQGSGNRSYASHSFCQGYQNQTGIYGATVRTSCFAQGYNAGAFENNTFAQGYNPRAIRANQKTWGSDVGLPGGAQKSIIVQGINTTDATPTNLLTFTLDTDKAYFLDVRLIVRNTTTDTDDALFYLSAPLLAWRNAAGGANLSIDPQALTLIQAGASAVTARLLTSTNDILLEVTGVAAQTFRWLVEFIFVERAGNL